MCVCVCERERERESEREREKERAKESEYLVVSLSRVIWVCSQVNLKVTEDSPKWLQVFQQFLFWPLFFQLRLGVPHQLLHIEHTGYPLLDLMLE